MDEENKENIENSEVEDLSVQKTQEQSDVETNANAIKDAAKVAATAYAGKLGGTAVELASRTKIGRDLLDTGGKIASKINRSNPVGNAIQNGANKISGSDDDSNDEDYDEESDVTSTNEQNNGNIKVLDNNEYQAEIDENDLLKMNNKSSKKGKGKSLAKKVIKYVIWKKYKWFIMGAISLVLVLTLLIVIGPNAGAMLDLTSGSGAGDKASSSGGVAYTAEEIEEKLIYVGDSRTVGMQNALNKTSINYIAEVGAGYSYLNSTAKGSLETMLGTDADKFVVFAFGVNDLGNIDSYINLYNSLISKYDSTFFYFMSVNPVDEVIESSHGYSVKNTSIESFNTKLSSTFGEKYIDTYSKVKGSIQTSDGIHYSNETYQQIHNIVVEYIQSKNKKAGGFTSLDSYPLEGEGTTLLQGKSLESAIGKDGLSELNSSIESAVNSAGRCTSDAVAAAGLNLVYGLQQKGYRIPYYWGGGHGAVSNGAKPQWGTKVGQSCSNTTCYSYDGIDCSGFVSWAITNAGAPIVGTTYTFLDIGKVSSFENAKPGNLLCNESHVILILENKGDYLATVESTGGTKGTVFRQYTKSSASYYKVLDMSDYLSSHCSG